MALPTVLRALAALERLEIVKEVTGRRRDRVFAYSDYLGILGAGTEPIVGGGAGGF
jgi:hypothetical protein